MAAGLVADDVAEHVFAEHDVELLGPADELHGGVVDVEELELHVGILRGDGLDRLAPEQAGLEHVGLVDDGDELAAQTRGLEADVGDALDLVRVVDHRVDGALAGRDALRALGIAEIDAAGQLAHDEDVEAAGDQFRLDRRGVHEAGITAGRAQVGVEAEMLAQRQQCGAFRLLVGRQVLPLGAADGAEENRLRVTAALQRVLGQRVAELVDGGAADGVFLRLDVEAKFLRGRVQEIETDGHYFRPDAVAGQHGDFIGVAHKGETFLDSFAPGNKITVTRPAGGAEGARLRVGKFLKYRGEVLAGIEANLERDLGDRFAGTAQ